MTIVAHTYPFVVGVDTHARTHTLAVLASSGRHIDTATFPTTPHGLARALAWTHRRTTPQAGQVLWVIEGAGTYGAHLAKMATDAGYPVVEAPRMNPRARHTTGKSDTLDATAIAAAALPLDTTRLRHPRTDTGPRAAIAVLTGAREHMNRERTATINTLTALLRIHDLGIDARKAPTTTQINQVSTWRTRTEPLTLATARTQATRLAQRITSLTSELADNKQQIHTLLKISPAAALLDEFGIGPLTAAACYTAWSHPGRLRSEAAFAALAGVNPIPASSGNTTRHRLNRSGDRQLNRALHMSIITRMAKDPTTKAYIEKRRTEGKTDREIRRILKRYLARRVYRLLTATTHPQPA